MVQEGLKRKLAAILSADVVGYSRLMGEDEESTIRTLTKLPVGHDISYSAASRSGSGCARRQPSG